MAAATVHSRVVRHSTM